MGRIIINIEDRISESEALQYVNTVIQNGRISRFNTIFCYATIFKDGTKVYADRTRAGSDTFRVFRNDDA